MESRLVALLLVCFIGVARGTWYGQSPISLPGLNLGGPSPGIAPLGIPGLMGVPGSVGNTVIQGSGMGLPLAGGVSAIGAGGGQVVGNVIVRQSSGLDRLNGLAALGSASPMINGYSAGLAGAPMGGVIVGGSAPGIGSPAMGLPISAPGLGSAAMGVPISAPGLGSAAMGVPISAPGLGSAAMGVPISAPGLGSAAMGVPISAPGLSQASMVGPLSGLVGSSAPMVSGMVGPAPIGQAVGGVMPNMGVPGMGGGNSGQVMSPSYYGPVYGASGDAYGGSASAIATQGSTATAFGGTAMTGPGVGPMAASGIGTGYTSGSLNLGIGNRYNSGFGSGGRIGYQCYQVNSYMCPKGTQNMGQCGGKKKKCKICCSAYQIMQICKSKGKKTSYYYC